MLFAIIYNLIRNIESGQNRQVDDRGIEEANKEGKNKEKEDKVCSNTYTQANTVDNDKNDSNQDEDKVVVFFQLMDHNLILTGSAENILNVFL